MCFQRFKNRSFCLPILLHTSHILLQGDNIFPLYKVIFMVCFYLQRQKTKLNLTCRHLIVRSEKHMPGKKSSTLLLHMDEAIKTLKNNYT